MAIAIDLIFEGAEADRHLLDFYDAAKAQAGFQRSLALTTHLVLNGEIITHAPALKNARILAYAPEASSWKTRALIVLGGIVAVNQTPAASPLGHLIFSTYDYVVSSSLGFHVDYDKSLGESLEIHAAQENAKKITESKLDSLIEKCEVAITDMHRPIVGSRSAEKATIIGETDDEDVPLGPDLDWDTWDFIATNNRSDQIQVFEGWVSSYNINTFKGRIYLSELGRPIPFMLSDEMKNVRKVALVTTSLRENAADRQGDDGRRYVAGFLSKSSNGRVKSIFITDMSSYEL